MTVLREGVSRAKITVHMGTCGIASGAREILQAFLESLKEADLPDVIVTTSGCAGLCSREPMATVELAGGAPVKYVDLTPARAREILSKHIVEGRPLPQYALALGNERLS
jgi:NADP-reducing hydrogenase subunit HndB